MSALLSRRAWLQTTVGVLATQMSQPLNSSPASSQLAGCITDVAGLKVGHFTESRRPTGCSVVLVEQGAVAGVDVRGSAPGTRETDLLNPLNTVQKIHAVVLAGGSAFGLDTATGVMQFLEEKGIGFDTGNTKVPIVPAAILYDLNLGDSRVRPDRQAGYLAAKSAASPACQQGNVGAGAGATVGKLFGFERAMKAGLGTSSLRVGDLVIGALVVVNAVGDVRDPRTGKILAGARRADGKGLVDSMDRILKGDLASEKLKGANTTIGVVATNASLSKVQASKIAQMAHDGLARSINPVHTPHDGDTLFALSTGTQPGSVNVTMIGALAAEAVSSAVRQAVLAATGLSGLPSHRDIFGKK